MSKINWQLPKGSNPSALTSSKPFLSSALDGKGFGFTGHRLSESYDLGGLTLYLSEYCTTPLIRRSCMAFTSEADALTSPLLCCGRFMLCHESLFLNSTRSISF